MKTYLCVLLLSLPAGAAPPKAERLWKEWYLVTQNGKAISFFSETAERRPADKQLAVTQEWMEKIGARSETYIGSVAAEESLSPVAFFVERKGAKPYKIDGRAKEKNLEITFKPGSPGLAKTSAAAPLEAHTYLSSFLPTALARRFKEGKGAFAFTAIVEDAGAMDVEIKLGIAEVSEKESKIGQETCREVILQIDGSAQKWWITSQGKACRVEFPSSGTRMELSTEKAAKKALGV